MQAQPQGWYPDSTRPGQERYWMGEEWSATLVRSAPGSWPATPPGATSRTDGYNQVVQVRYRRGWIGLFSGESQTKALQRCLGEINARGRVVVAATTDQWSFFARLGWAFVAAVTLLFVVRAPNLLLITAPQ